MSDNEAAENVGRVYALRLMIRAIGDAAKSQGRPLIEGAFSVHMAAAMKAAGDHHFFDLTDAESERAAAAATEEMNRVIRELDSSRWHEIKVAPSGSIEGV